MSAEREAETQRLHEQVQTLMAGEPLDVAWEVAVRSLAISIMCGSDTQEEACAVTEKIPDDLKSCIRLNWDEYQRQRALFGGVGQS